MNDLIRHQLRELRIDPDVACGPQRRQPLARRRWCGWLRRHLGEVIAIGLLAGSLLGLSIWAMAASTSAAGAGMAAGDAARAAASTRTRAALGGLTVWLSQPVVRDLGPGTGVPSPGGLLTLAIEALNESDAVIAVPARDLLLVDARGALFAPAWAEPTGLLRDGFADPDHTLLALSPGGRTQLALLFMVRGPGPFSLRYRRADSQPEAVVVPLTNEPPAPPPPPAP